MASFARIERDGGERFHSLRRDLDASSLGINVITLAPGQRGRIHAHETQEELYLVLEGRLTLVLDGGPRELAADEIARVPPEVRRQLANDSDSPVVILALGATGEHVGRDGLAWESFEDDGPGRPPQEVPAPPEP
ncbi:MAG TPA: cupin domain-containing protein [Solirubrobacteraceae bacterium]|nr:cupin domain-containing protein [Solirubrobacteraceae bacterium]